MLVYRLIRSQYAESYASYRFIGSQCAELYIVLPVDRLAMRQVMNQFSGLLAHFGYWIQIPPLNVKLCNPSVKTLIGPEYHI